MRRLSILAVSALRLPILSLASPLSPSTLDSDDASNTTPYLSFPHSPRHGSAFLPSSSDSDASNLDQLSLLAEPTNPAPAWNRHPISSRDAIQPIDPSRMDKRAVVSQVDLPFPPSACKSISPSSPANGFD